MFKHSTKNNSIPDIWHEVAGILQDKKINALAYQKQVRKGWERRLKRQIKLTTQKSNLKKIRQQLNTRVK